MTLAELRARLDAYVNRQDVDYVANRDAFLNTGHRWVERKFHGREALFQKWVTTEPVWPAVTAVPLPACYRASAELRVYRLPDRAALTRIPTPWLREPFLDRGMTIDLRDPSQLGTPTYFAVIGRALELRPAPSQAVDLEIVGTGWADPMKEPTDETVVTQEAPDAVLYAACREVWLFMGDDPQQQYWQAQAERAVQEWIGDRIHEEDPPTLVMDVPG